jgi:hypothetical protein
LKLEIENEVDSLKRCLCEYPNDATFKFLREKTSSLFFCSQLSRFYGAALGLSAESEISVILPQNFIQKYDLFSPLKSIR